MVALLRSQVIARDWLADGRRVVACTLVETVGSAPLDPGAEMVIDDSGRIEGSVTGGCVEGTLVEEAERIFAGGAPRVVSYGISHADALGVGLMCGGTVRVFVHTLDERALEPLDAVAQVLEEDRPVALATLLDGDAAGAKMAVAEEGVVGAIARFSPVMGEVARFAREGGLETDAGYIGALGSRRTHADRVRRLRERGVDDDQLERIAAPCGLDIGARTPAETAISIVGEVIARRTGRGGEPLGETAGPIHGREAALS